MENKMKRKTIKEIKADLKRLGFEAVSKCRQEPYKSYADKPYYYRKDSLTSQGNYLEEVFKQCESEPVRRFAAFKLARIIEKMDGSYDFLKELWAITGQKGRIADNILEFNFVYGQKEWGTEFIGKEELRRKIDLVQEARQIYSEIGDNIKNKATGVLLSELYRYNTYLHSNRFSSLNAYFKAQNTKQRWLDRILGGHF